MSALGGPPPHMTDCPEAFVVATTPVQAGIIRRARERVIVVAPALSPGLAAALVDRLPALPPSAITIVIDSDPEVYRLGYGTLEALEAVVAAAERRNVPIRRQRGVRIGLIVGDAETLIFTPTPALVEAGPNTQGAANAIRLNAPPTSVEADLGLQEAPPRVGRDAVQPNDVAAVKEDLAANPPQKFDLARKVRVFNSYIEFVELEIKGTEIARHLVTIPNHLLAVIPKRTRTNLQASCRLVAEADALSGDAIARERRLYTRRYLRVIPGYGTAILRADRDAFDKSVERLHASVRAFGAQVRARLQEQIDRSIAELVRSLLPALARRPPAEWIPFTGDTPDKATVATHLEFELREAFGRAAATIWHMSVTCRFKGVTYELLSDASFIQKAKAAFPGLPVLHSEEVAAQAAKADRP